VGHLVNSLMLICMFSGVSDREVLFLRSISNHFDQSKPLPFAVMGEIEDMV